MIKPKERHNKESHMGNYINVLSGYGYGIATILREYTCDVWEQDSSYATENESNTSGHGAIGHKTMDPELQGSTAIGPHNHGTIPPDGHGAIPDPAIK